MADTAVTAESAPASPGTEGYQDYLALKAQSGAPAVVEPTEETETESAPVETGSPAQTETPEEKERRERSERDRSRTNRRLGQFKGRAERAEARLEQMERELTELRGKRSESAPATPTGKPKLSEYVSQIGQKYETYEQAEDAYQDARAAHHRDELKAELARENSEKTQRETATRIRSAFQKKIKAYGDGHEGFEDSLESVTEVLDQDGKHISDAIVRAADHPGEVIDYLAKHPEEMDRLLDMSPERARLRLGVIDAKFDKSEETPTKEQLPARPTRNVAGRSDTPNKLGLQRKAAESNDFTAWERNSDSAKTKARLGKW